MEGISSNNIQDFVVSSAARRKLFIRSEATPSILATYTVLSTTPGLSYESLSAQLVTAVDSGQFNKYLSEYSEAIPGASALADCTSSPVTTENLQTSPTQHHSHNLSAGAIAGIAIAVIIVISLILGVLLHYIHPQWSTLNINRLKSGAEKSQSRSAHEDVTSIEMDATSKKDGIRWTENVARTSLTSQR